MRTLRTGVRQPLTATLYANLNDTPDRANRFQKDSSHADFLNLRLDPEIPCIYTRVAPLNVLVIFGSSRRVGKIGKGGS